MSQSIQAFAIGEIAIRQHDGLYSLNDLHKAAGGEARHKPSEWLRNQQAQELVQEIGKAGIPALDVKKGGKNPGAYACRELVIAYAAWISAAFHLKVIRVFLAVATPQPAPAQTNLDYDRISPAQAQDLKEIVAAIVQAGIQGYGETWARFQRKFRVNSYLELPASHFDDARAYLQGKLPSRPTLPPGKMLVDRMHLASIYTDLGKLRARIDAMAMPAQDLPPLWLEQHAIKA